MSVVLMHLSGNNFVRALLQAMQEEDMLAEFNTAIACGLRKQNRSDENAIMICLPVFVIPEQADE